MSAEPPSLPPSRESELARRKRESNRLAVGILGVSAGCGCLFFVGAFVFGMVLGAIDARRKLATPTPKEDPIELRLSE